MSRLNNQPLILLSEPDYELSLQIRDYFERNNNGEIISNLRDGIDTIDFLKTCKLIGIKPDILIINPSLPYSKELFGVLDSDTDYQELKTIIFSQMNNKSRINKNTFYLELV